jgi:hypothetical protein
MSDSATQPSHGDKDMAANGSSRDRSAADPTRSTPGDRRLAWCWSGTRALAGAVMYLAPRATDRAWVGRRPQTPADALVVRSFAIRDLAIGLGSLGALRNDQPLMGWLGAALLSDVGDLIGARFLPRSKRRMLLSGMAATSVVADLVLLQRSRRPYGQPTAGAPIAVPDGFP